jgi:dihydropteroate synthase
MWAVAGGVIPLDDPVVMGILNVTPDSFSDGGANENIDAAVAAGIAMSTAGARIIDVGGESTRPGADIVPADIEIQRTLPVVERLVAENITVSIDTSKVEVAAAALAGGAAIVNDVTGLADPAMARLCAQAGAGVVVMHMQGNPRTMMDDPQYEDVVSEVAEFLVERARTSEESGISSDAIVIDPGIGFGKTFEHNLALMNGIDSLTSTGYPVLVGPSRKGFLGKILEPIHGPTTPAERDGATAGAVAVAIARGASIVRVHNVPLALEVANTVKAMVRSGGLRYRNG